MERNLTAFLLVAATAGLAGGCSKPPAPPPEPPAVQRGAYLATVGGCHDCHSPKIFTAKGPEVDPARLLSGHPADAPLPEIPAGVIAPDRWGALTNGHLSAWAGPWGVSFAINLTPDATGLGSWTEQDFVRSLRTGKHAGVGRPILPPMPWLNYAKMSDADLKALFAYLRSLPAIVNKVPEPLPPSGAPPAPAA